MKLPLVFAFLICFTSAFGQGIRGLITDENNEPMPYASIYIKQKGTGTSSNIDGRYELRLPPGKYEITYQFVGFTTQQKTVTIDNTIKVVDIKLQPQTESLQEVAVTGSTEDPAYSIMRKAIAKAPYHLLQNDGYTAAVYMKGTGGLDKIPGMFQKTMEKDGVDTSRVFTSESVSEVSFERPNTFKEKVISVRTSGEDLDGANPNSFVNASFYQPKVAESISPFSPKAFSYYRFRYLGNFVDRGYKIHKIEVKPRSGGEQVFEGLLYVRDEFWNIHSLELNTKVQFLDLKLVQFFAPVQDEIWMPVTQQFDYKATIFGFSGKYKYMASVINYKVKKNDELDETVILVDEKIEEAPEEIEAIKKGNVDKGLEEVFAEDKGVSRKQFRKLMKEYEKEEKKESGTEDIISDYEYKIDSLAAQRDSAYWANIRSVPLTQKEIDSYRKDDSIYVAEKQDSTNPYNPRRFDFGDLLMGGRSQITDSVILTTPGIIPRFRFNTVEGFNLDLEATLNLYENKKYHWSITPTVRYGFSSTELYAKLNTGLTYGTIEQRTSWNLEGGHFINQFYENSINPFINTVYTLFVERNYMKLYDQDYVKLSWDRNFRYKWRANASLQWASRNSLNNTTDFGFFRYDKYHYTSNDPVNVENAPVTFENSKALTSKINVAWKPWLKFRKYNGMLRPVEESSPEFRLAYNAGWDNILGSTVNFQQLELGVKTSFDLGVRATFDIDAQMGTFFNNDGMLLTDFKHFNGGLTEIAPLSVTGNYRLLDYYNYSTQQQYISALSYIRFRKFLFTQLPLVRLSGVKENLFVNYLKTTNSPHYTEIGYGIDNVFRIFRIEFVQSFDGIDPLTFGIRVGVGSLIQVDRR
ncbi:hypothetical protein Oweho_2563 [Owenweeksia hongkongensis DSM 17368]|uniref:Uncharacterized protein n=1 Tax=Owenweeksia hongkongensis (strain DSM 17368 / CIP 108786 / JCM 12287 / NRRL B-23963 / UST20020801) TaxID=926562 RepID=G8R8D8_OWEHD|nr:DUF5686 and carboxypeptidase regulatory-like domain-containing protein [Owenweeksia hongkongensis]AEV33531.1 hypothetical protein Oweho_2563 [Owenweeksia hongkongensis DSM 17368]